ncbi:MAG: glutamine--fructose-6-phosphate transaminase (isomerizing) [Alphaproteobacteria bacterium]|nr:MAG: glutamine--fructose-6-phosphate transaminase (isomerizing) [Alphaproteobacteria bacterium]
MCGIVGIVGRRPVAERLLKALERLEYRGYDSAGIAVLDSQGRLRRLRREGKLAALVAAHGAEPIDGMIGIGHTRWATHGAPCERNAHPHLAGPVALVHNGIIENYRALRDELVSAGAVLESDTDTEVLAHLLARARAEGLGPREAVQALLQRITGAFALAILFADAPDRLYAARQGSPLAVGVSGEEGFLGSDALALAGLAERVAFLEEGDWAELVAGGVTIFDAAGRVVDRPFHRLDMGPQVAAKGNYRHYMLKEIHEQPTAVAETLGPYLDPGASTVRLPGDVDARSLRRLHIIACGTSFYAGLAARYWIERLARMPVEVDIASEFRYRDPVLEEGEAALFISQSGETADTLAALRLARRAGLKTIAIVNVPHSTIAREADVVLPTHAGPEIGVASTKAFTAQLAVLAALAIGWARARAAITQEEEHDLVETLAAAPSLLAAALHADGAMEAMAHELMHASDVLYLGRDQLYPIALEGALKLKEISYIHAEGYAAGEMKHGPIALIDESVPVVVLADSGKLFDKVAANVEEVQARGGRVFLIGAGERAAGLAEHVAHAHLLPEHKSLLAPLAFAVPVQLLAYHTAVLKGTDVDQPRNLAKSVTVE